MVRLCALDLYLGVRYPTHFLFFSRKISLTYRNLCTRHFPLSSSNFLDIYMIDSPPASVLFCI